MGKTLVALEYSILAIIASAMFFWTASENRLDDWRLEQVLVASVLLFGSFTAVVLVMKSVADLLLSNRMTMAEASVWEHTRVKGKANYILNALIICGTPLLAGIAGSEIAWYPSETMSHFAIPCITSLASVGLIADTVWNYQDWVYSRERGNERSRSLWSRLFRMH